MKPITNIYLSLEIDSGNAAFVGSLEDAEAELCRLLDEDYELDPDWVNEWFSNRTDAAITAGEVVKEASGWEFS